MYRFSPVDVLERRQPSSLRLSKHATMTTALVRPTILYAWQGPSLFIANTRGDCSDDQTLSGYYFREARHLHYRSTLTARGDGAWVITDSRIAAPIDLASQQSLELGLDVDGSGADGAMPAVNVSEREQRLRDWRDRFARFTAHATARSRALWQRTSATSARSRCSKALQMNGSPCKPAHPCIRPSSHVTRSQPDGKQRGLIAARRSMRA